MAKVSVIVLVYKSEPYIAATIHSVLAQTYKNFEILVIDDGSPDRSVEICRQFNDPRIRIIRQENRGVPAARNTGIRHARGEYIAFLDGDDLWLPPKLEKQVTHLESSPFIGMSFCRSSFIDVNGKHLGTYQMPKLKRINLSYLLRCNPIGNGSAGVIRRKVLEDIKFTHQRDGNFEDCYFDEQFRVSGGETDFLLRILIQTKWEIEGIPAALTLYRVNTGGMTANLLKRLESASQEVEKTRSYAPELNLRWRGAIKAYYIRYLARSAVRFREGKIAVNLIHLALATHWQMVFEELYRTCSTLIAAYLLLLLPQKLYNRIETLFVKAIGTIQERKIRRDTLEKSEARSRKSEVNRNNQKSKIAR
ncbi:glycosyltransferase family 2 protein [Scytonema millei]|uniref:Glycosyltransferase family 2 protein n=1 Tax=Scytonema millei VB511283 TaxID=1245923 RepID=A0A9X5E109_9CYAN|nr:glycosyltransferase family 2 protein [Scytonema millei]NHC33368.1 glycosyltransferase family 2 protein [Scytonema millei VB511283]